MTPPRKGAKGEYSFPMLHILSLDILGYCDEQCIWQPENEDKRSLQDRVKTLRAAKG